MIENGFLLCKCGKKIMPITAATTISTEVYCVKCKSYFNTVIAQNKLFIFEKIDKKSS
jgi:hypothetical protein